MKILIIGQGLAGTILSYKLIKKGHFVTVVDDPLKQKSSTIAGGMVNPVVFRRLTKSWMIDELYPEFIKTSNELEILLNTKLFYPKPIYKIFGKDESLFWEKKFIDNKLHTYINGNAHLAPLSPYLKTPHGYGIVSQGGWFDIQTLIRTYRSYLEEKKCYSANNINLSADLSFSNDQIIWHDNAYDKVILCLGSYTPENIFFAEIKYKNTKGEVLTFRSSDYSERNKIISKNIFILPTHNNLYKTGSSYAWEWDDLQPTKKAKEEILEKLNKIADFKYTIDDHQVGIRPTAHDRRPVIGFSEENPSIGIFNGLGSKGILLAPWSANQLTNKIENPEFEIHSEINVKRYY